MALLPPQNVLTANAGGGAVHVVWEPPVSGTTPTAYRVYMATSAHGTYSRVSERDVTGQHTVVRNCPLGVTVYTRVRSVDGSGVESGNSFWPATARWPGPPARCGSPARSAT